MFRGKVQVVSFECICYQNLVLSIKTGEMCRLFRSNFVVVFWLVAAVMITWSLMLSVLTSLYG